MNLDEAQRKQVTQWIAEGLKLSEIQNRLNSELGVKLTYMEVRLLVDDLKLTPKDPEPVKPPPELAANPPIAPKGPKPAGAAATGRVSVSVDQIARPGAVVSGKVTFSDAKTAEWFIDQTGQLGLRPDEAGYRPPAADVKDFQAALDRELSKMGL